MGASDLTFDKAGNSDPLSSPIREVELGSRRYSEPITGKRGFRFHVLLSYLDVDPDPLFSPLSLAFDPAGDLWVASITRTGFSLIEYTPDQLTASGGPTPGE